MRRACRRESHSAADGTFAASGWVTKKKNVSSSCQERGVDWADGRQGVSIWVCRAARIFVLSGHLSGRVVGVFVL